MTDMSQPTKNRNYYGSTSYSDEYSPRALCPRARCVFWKAIRPLGLRLRLV
jgi:hypothetical protein